MNYVHHMKGQHTVWMGEICITSEDDRVVAWLTNNWILHMRKLSMINAIVVVDRLLQSILLSAVQEEYTMDARLIYSLTHDHLNVNSILTNGANDVLMRPVNDLISVAIVYKTVTTKEDTLLNCQSFKLPPLVLRLIRQLQRYFHALNAVDITKNILSIKQRLHLALNSHEHALKRFDDNEYSFIDAVIKNGSRVYAVKDNLSGPLVCMTDSAEMPVMVVHNRVTQELECNIKKGIEFINLTFHPIDANRRVEKYDVELRPPSLSHSYKHPVWTICPSCGGKYSLHNLPDGLFLYAEVVFEGFGGKSGDIYRFYFQ